MIHLFGRSPHQFQAMAAFQQGLKRHGLRSCILRQMPRSGPLTVVWGLRQARKVAGPVLILECGHINGTSGDYRADRARFVSASWNDLHGLADPMPPAPDDRWKALGIELRDWAGPGPTLVLGQHPGDASVPVNYARLLASLLERLPDARFRPHPLVKRSERHLHDELDESGRVVTWSSNASVEALIAGVPVVTLSEMAITRPVSAHSLDAPDWRGDRLPFLSWLAYRQWTLAEYASGEAWAWLRQGAPQR